MQGIGDYAVQLLTALVYSVVLLLAWIGVTAVAITVGRGGLNLTRFLNYLTPFYAAFDLLTRRFLLVFTVVGVVVILTGAWPDGDLILPGPGSLERRWGEKVFGMFWMLFVADALFAGGFPPSMEPVVRLHNISMFRLMAVILGVAVMVWPGHYAIGTLLTTLVYLAFVVHYGRRLAVHGYENSIAVDVEPLPEAEPGHELAFVHLTDLHLTETPESPRVEKGTPGNARLAALPVTLQQFRPRWLLVSGDLVDHGGEAEWTEATRLLELVRSAVPGLRIVLTPGNHDLATAYTTRDAVFAQLLAIHRRVVLADADGTYLRRFLSHTAALEPEFRTASGALLKDMLDADTRAHEEMVAGWSALGSAPSETHLDTLAVRGHQLYPDVTDAEWQRILRVHTPRRFEELDVPALWLKRWFAWFPLWCHDVNHGEAVVVLNSIAPDPTHLGGSWGSVGREQFERLDPLLKSLRPRRTYLLCHHAPLRWNDEAPPSAFETEANIEWSTTSMLAEDVQRIRNASAALAADHGEIVFLCGHRHGGREHRTRKGTWPAGIVIEGASFADAETAIAAGWMDEDGCLVIGQVPNEPASHG